MMSEAIKRGIKKKWPKEVRAAFETYYPGEDVLAALERTTSGPKEMAMMLRLAAVAHLEKYPNDARRSRSEKIH
jgi:hypothetical protein